MKPKKTLASPPALKQNPFQNAPVITIAECKAVPFTLAQFVPGIEVGTLVCAVGTRDDGFPM